MHVLILGGRAPVALEVARQFAAQGATVHIADSVRCRMSAWSTAVATTHALAKPRFAMPQFAKDLNRIIADHNIGMVVPTCEEAFFLSRIRTQLPTLCNVFVAPFDQLRDLHSKWRFLDLAVECGAVVPRSARVVDLAAAREWAAGRAVVLKPEYSRFGVHVRLYPRGIPSNAPALPKLGYWVAQEFQNGTEFCSYSVSVSGVLQAHVAYQPRYRMGNSSSYYFEEIQEPAILRFVRAFTAKIGFTGQISFDWIRSKSGEVSVLECNPRAISGVHLFADSDGLLRAMLGQVDSVVMPTSGTPRMIAAVMLAAGLPHAVRTRRLRDWLVDWRRAKDVLSVAGDRKPLLGAISDIVAFAAIAAQSGSSMREVSTRDIEWDGEMLAE